MQGYYNTERRKGKHLTFGERNQIFAMVRMIGVLVFFTLKNTIK